MPDVIEAFQGDDYEYEEYTLEEAYFNQLEEERLAKKRRKNKKKKRKKYYDDEYGDEYEDDGDEWTELSQTGYPHDFTYALSSYNDQPFITGAYSNTSHSNLLKEVGLPLLIQRRLTSKLVSRLVLINKIINSKTPSYLKKLLPAKADSSHNTRQSKIRPDVLASAATHRGKTMIISNLICNYFNHLRFVARGEVASGSAAVSV